MSDVVRCDDVWCGENAIRPKNSAQELLLCVLFFRLVMCDMVRCDVWCLVRCNDVWCVMWWDCVFRLVMSDVVRCDDVWCGENAIRPKNWDAMMCDVWCGEIVSFGLWCLMWWDVMTCDVVRMPSGPRTRPKNFFFVFSSFGLWCVMWWDVMSGEMQWCVMCDVVRFRLSGPRTRPKNFFSVCSSFGLWCVMWWDVMSDVWWGAMMCDVWCGEISPIRPKHSAQELLLCVLFFRLVMCDMVRVLTHIECSHIVRTHRVLTHSVLTHRVLTHSAHT